jgi:hypothetical protein
VSPVERTYTVIDARSGEVVQSFTRLFAAIACVGLLSTKARPLHLDWSRSTSVMPNGADDTRDTHDSDIAPRR